MKCTVDNVWHAEHEGDPYFLVIVVPSRAWRVTRQVDMSSTYREHTVNLRKSGQLWCDCEGFRRGGKCRHVSMVNDFLKENSGDT